MLKPEGLLEYAEQLKDGDAARISLYFITRHPEAGMGRTARVVDKFDLKIIKTSIAPDITKFFRYTLSNQIISHASKDDIVMRKYTVIDDDIDNKICAYAVNDTISFSRVIDNDVRNDKPIILTSLAEIQNDLWAYCIKAQKGAGVTYFLREVSRGKVTTNESQNMTQHVFALFDKADRELRSFDGSAVDLDDKIDCIYIEDQFHVFHKKSFEAIVGLKVRFTEAAQRTLNTIKELDLIEGLDVIEQAILHKPSLRKVLTRIAEKGNHTALEKDDVQAMNDVLKMFQNEEFKTNECGKLVIEDKGQGRSFLKLLNDYYKQGMTTEKYYGTDSGNMINPIKT